MALSEIQFLSDCCRTGRITVGCRTCRLACRTVKLLSGYCRRRNSLSDVSDRGGSQGETLLSEPIRYSYYHIPGPRCRSGAPPCAALRVGAHRARWAARHAKNRMCLHFTVRNLGIRNSHQQLNVWLQRAIYSVDRGNLIRIIECLPCPVPGAPPRGHHRPWAGHRTGAPPPARAVCAPHRRVAGHSFDSWLCGGPEHAPPPPIASRTRMRGERMRGVRMAAWNRTSSSGFTSTHVRPDRQGLHWPVPADMCLRTHRRHENERRPRRCTKAQRMPGVQGSLGWNRCCPAALRASA